MLFRPAKIKDINQILVLLKHRGSGLTSLPLSKKELEKKLEESQNFFKGKKSNICFFVLEINKKIIGISGLVPRLGEDVPFYLFQIKKNHYKSPQIRIKNTITTLSLKKIQLGYSEICGLFLHPKYRQSNNGRLLSLARFHYVASFQKKFQNMILSDMRGSVNSKGISQFWETINRHFFKNNPLIRPIALY